MKDTDGSTIPKQSPGSTRRSFIKHTVGLTFAIGASGSIAIQGAQALGSSTAESEDGALRPNIWVTINPDSTIVIKYAGTEMGQGSMTHVPMMLAEYIDADWDKVKVEIVKVHDTAFGNPIFQNMLYTAGSTHVAIYGKKMRVAGSQARKLLLASVARHWDVDTSALSTEPGVVIHPASGRRISYGDIVTQIDIPSQIPELNEADYKPAADFRYIGKQVMRRDVPAKSNGSAQYGMDVQVPGMAYAAILRAPVEGEKPLQVNDSAAKQVKDVTAIVVLPYGVAVVGTTVEATKKAKQKLQVTWSESSQFRGMSSEASIVEYSKAARDLKTEGVAWSSQGEVRGAFAGANEIVEALYTTDPAYHAQMEPMNATASVSNDGKSAEIWVGTQTQSLTIIGAAEALETDIANITLHPLTMGGGFGRRSLLRQQYIDDALFVSRELKQPIKVIWSREDDLEAGNFRTAAAQYMRGAFDETGKLTAVQQRVAAPAILPTMNRHRWESVKPKDVITMLGSENHTYDIPHHLAEHIRQARCSKVIAFRGVGTGYTKFAMESFIDELARSRNADPLEFRLQLCHNNPRMTDLLKAVAESAQWGEPRDAGVGLGLAVAGYHKSLAAGIVQLSVEQETGQIKVHKFWTVADPGLVISPRNAQAQVIGNIIFGLSSTLKERIQIEDGVVQQSNFHNYPIMRMNEVPDIEATVLSTDNPSSGVGELGTAMVAPAIANAIASLTGKRIRHQPMTPDIVAAALRG
jgi:isoquinoline 1-oxidoreductase beta subunit